MWGMGNRDRTSLQLMVLEGRWASVEAEGTRRVRVGADDSNTDAAHIIYPVRRRVPKDVNKPRPNICAPRTPRWTDTRRREPRSTLMAGQIKRQAPAFGVSCRAHLPNEVRFCHQNPDGFYIGWNVAANPGPRAPTSSAIDAITDVKGGLLLLWGCFVSRPFQLILIKFVWCRHCCCLNLEKAGSGGEGPHREMCGAPSVCPPPTGEKSDHDTQTRFML